MIMVISVISGNKVIKSNVFSGTLSLNGRRLGDVRANVLINREIKIHVYAKRQTSDSS